MGGGGGQLATTLEMNELQQPGLQKSVLDAGEGGKEGKSRVMQAPSDLALDALSTIP